jgi:predicted nucleotidyltransferase
MIRVMAGTPQLDSILARMEYGRALKGELLMSEGKESWVPYAQPLLDAVALFEELKIGYALIGGVAAMYYGRARFTEDVDFVAASGHMDVLRDHPGEMEKNHFDPACTHKLYHQSGVQVDIWKDEFSDDIVSRAREVQLAGRTIRVIDPHDLIAMKLRAGRLKDDYDISEIALRIAIDTGRLKSLLTADEFERFEQIRKRV